MARTPIPQATERARNTRATLGRIWQYLGRQRSGLIIVMVMTVVIALLELIAPFLIGRAIDRFIMPHDREGLLRLCLMLLAVYVSASALSWIQAYVMAGVSQRTVWELRQDLFGRLQLLPIRFFDKTSHGELMSKATNDVENVSNSLNQSLIQIMASIITITGSFAMMLYLNVWLTVVCLVTVPLVMGATKLISKRTKRLFKEQQQRLGELNGYIEETISGQRVVKTFNREAVSIEHLGVINEGLKQAGTRAQILSGMFGPVMNMMNHFSYILIAAIGGWMAFRDLTTVGIIISFLSYSRQFGRPLNDLANQYNMIQAGVAGAERVFEILDTDSEFHGDEEGKELPAEVLGEVSFQDVSFSYNSDLPTLRHITFTAKPGDLIALVGPTGAGKTTIINLLTRFYDIDEGSITIDGHNIQGFDKKSLRSRLGIVLQDVYLFSGTVRDNLRFGRLDATDQEIEQAAMQANADGFIRELPQGYDTVLTADGCNLSQGQRQLLTIARAILADPAILILDEATSSVDTRTEMHIQEAMRVLMQGRTSFVIAHRLSTIRNADTILYIQDGKIAERGSHDQLIAHKGRYYELYANQFQQVI
ncbi:ABC transporter ATP-binding protein [Paenibacillus nasutitermitis]|uniref:ABC transporter ATP-binding protein YfiC n=1 Tax=Paenibacillus nasutitermitis TaxID=1652958 RepID=A0A916ZA34_9BACL|nr:ABC transporter ATP-binding protein [Paenibacillus nasutitermitis]GGD82213.1 putative ABC transporter ATP-binding protein YfiC [Paenibacillus nasutitermitis]